MDEVIREFVAESRENLQRMEQELVLLETKPDDAETVADIFRTIHTIKGTCGFFEFGGLEAVAHAGESLLSKVRDRVLVPDAEVISALLALIDAVRSFLANIDATGSEGEVDTARVIERLSALEREQRQTPLDQPEEGERGGVDVSAGAREDIGATPVEENADSTPPPARQQTATNPAPGQSSVRLDVGLLDTMMGLVGELVLARNQVVEHAAHAGSPSLSAVSQRLNVVTSRLQETVMQTRMQPIDTIFGALPRLVRDTSLAGGKRVRLTLDGSDTELDRTVIEAVKDPLTHLVRNAVDHGIEAPPVRHRAGKAEEGHVHLHASHENGQVIIAISDDGAGIDSDDIRARALELGLAEEDRLSRASDSEILQLAFSPGLSTARRITNVSGRGVGLDVVRNNIERIGGSVDLTSTPGVGTTVRIRLPMTLAIIQALLVRSRGQRFAIPQLSTMELVGLDAGGASRHIEHVHAAPVFRLRGKLLPIIHLADQLGLDGDGDDGPRGAPAQGQVLVVLRANDREFGLAVDAVDETQEIVVKPLSRLLHRIPILAGTTILGDGKVALILDVAALAQRANVINERREAILSPQADGVAAPLDAREAVLLFSSPDDGRMAIPLTDVAHLHTVDPASVERAGGLEVIQYRGEILPLIRVHEALDERRRRPRRAEEEPSRSSTLFVVIYATPQRRVGLVVDRIVDIVEETLEVQRPGTRDCVAGTMVMRGRITEILDVEGLVSRMLDAEDVAAGGDV